MTTDQLIITQADYDIAARANVAWGQAINGPHVAVLAAAMARIESSPDTGGQRLEEVAKQLAVFIDAHEGEDDALIPVKLERLRNWARIIEGLSNPNTPVGGQERVGERVKRLPEERQEYELGLLYNYHHDDSRQFTRWQMMSAIAHGYRIATDPDPAPSELNPSTPVGGQEGVGEGMQIGTRCSRCGTTAPEAFANQCNQPECEYRNPLPSGASDELVERSKSIFHDYDMGRNNCHDQQLLRDAIAFIAALSTPEASEGER